MSVDPPRPNIDSDDDSGPPSPAGEPTQTVLPKAAARIPKRIGHYHIKRVLASGGMGTVYEATQEKPRRTVALKLMKQGIASRSALRRFEYESQILARLRHLGIAQVYEAGTHRDDPRAPGATVPFFAPALRSAEERLGRPANPTVYTRAEFAKKLEARYHSPRSVVEKEEIFILGNELLPVRRVAAELATSWEAA